MSVIRGLTIESLLGYKTFLLLFSIMLFIDTSSLFFTNIAIRKIDLSFIKEYTGVILIGIVMYSFFMSTIVIIINVIINFIYSNRPKSMKNNDVDYTDKNLHFRRDLYKTSIAYDNTVLYNYCNEDKQEDKEIRTIQYISTSLIILIIGNFFISTDSLIHAAYIFFDTNNLWYFKLFAILLFFFMLFIFSESFSYPYYGMTDLDHRVLEYLNYKDKNLNTSKESTAHRESLWRVAE